MRRSQRTNRTAKPMVEVSSSDSEEEKSPPKKQKLDLDVALKLSESSSDESDSGAGAYLKSSDKIDLNFPIFKDIEKKESFENIEQHIFAGVSRFSDSESDLSDNEKSNSNQIEAIPSTSAIEAEPEKITTTRLNFSQLTNYNKKLEEAKKHAEQYEAKKQQNDYTNQDILNLLNAGESGLKNISLNSADFESSNSEDENWEEIKTKDADGDDLKEKTIIPVNGVEITVGMPENIRKKKEVDMLAAVKRRLNRIRKENQVFVHRVHSLCWIAHGNYVNSMINEPAVMALALSLIPSEKCYPPDRIDLSYLEQTLHWYRNTIKNAPKPIPKDMPLDKLLQFQIASKEAFDKRMLVFIFVAILRSLGIQARLVMNFVVEPLRPPESDLHSLSTKNANDKNTTKRSTDKKSKDESKKSKKDDKKTVDAKKSSSANKKSQKEKSNEVKKEKSKEIKKETSKEKNEKESQKSGKNTKKVKSNEASTCKVNVDDGKTDLPENNKKESSVATSKLVEKSKSLKVNDTEKSTKRRSKSENESTSTDKFLKPPPTKRSRSSNSKPSEKNDPREEKPIKTDKTKTKNKPNKKDIKVKLPVKSKSPIPQVDGNADSDSSDLESVIQVDGNSDQTPKPKERPKRRKISIPSYIESNDSEDDFQRSPFTAKNTPPAKLNLQKLKSNSKASTSSSSQVVVNLNRLKSPKTVKKSPKTVKKSPKKEIVVNVNRLKSNKKVQLDVRKDIVNLLTKSPSPSKIRIKQKKNSENSDSDYAPEQKNKSKQKGVNVWAEVFLESEEKWISVDVVHIQVHCVKELYNRATHPVSYIMAWNNDNTLKDVTKRYCQNYNTATRKLRTSQSWWDETLRPFTRKIPTVRDREEDEEFEQQQLEKPLPTSIAEYKNHPLYVLKRHLLKFESIYPPDAPALGFVRNEPVYSRSCVYTLHSRDIWLKHAKVVKPGEKPYKIVKARPKYDKLSNSMITDQLLEIFGPWQVQDYEPPTAENGVVPRNAFGNVELFKACMLPKKTVHLQLPGLNKVARKLNIDCASAIVGFDFHGGWSHPTYDGFVVCEEFAETLIEAWHKEQEELERKENEKIETRVYDNWKRLIKGLLIRERLKKKYGFGEETSGKATEKEHKKKQKITFSTKKKAIVFNIL